MGYNINGECFVRKQNNKSKSYQKRIPNDYNTVNILDALELIGEDVLCDIPSFFNTIPKIHRIIVPVCFLSLDDLQVYYHLYFDQSKTNMKNIELLISQNIAPNKHARPSRHGKNMIYEYRAKSRYFGLEALADLICYINSISSKHSLALVPLYIHLGEIEFVDKLTYVLFECLCYTLINQGHRNSRIYFKYRSNIFSEGIVDSPINELIKHPQNKVAFLKKFQFDLNKTHFRKVIKNTSDDIFLLSKLMQDIDFFLKTRDIEKGCRQEISEVVCELVGNAREHACADCLVDLDITEKSYVNSQEPESSELYGGINIVVANFSERIIAKCISEKIDSLLDDQPIKSTRYHTVLAAKENHAYFFGNDYILEDFFTLTSFQHKISGRINNSDTGGTGLTTLIRTLEERSADSICYMLSGHRQINFLKDYLIYDDDNWVGFNATGNYLDSPPEKECFAKSPIMMPGTAYNLNFVLKQEENRNDPNNKT